MTDRLIKALAYNKEIRAYILDGSSMVQEGAHYQDTWHTATAAYGRALIGTCLLSTSLLKNTDDQLTVRIQGDGPLGYMVLDGNVQGHVKGYVQHPHIALELNEKGKLDVRGAVGQEGIFAVSKDMGLKTPFGGQVPLVSGELAEDFTYYMAVSEQIPSVIALSVVVGPDDQVVTAGGFMLQVLPHASEETITELEKTVKSLPDVSKMMASDLTLEAMLGKIVGEDNYEILEEMPIAYSCDCSRERYEKAMIALGADELQTLIDEDGQAEAVCHFCNKKYLFTKDDLEAMINKNENEEM